MVATTKYTTFASRYHGAGPDATNQTKRHSPEWCGKHTRFSEDRWETIPETWVAGDDWEIGLADIIGWLSTTKDAPLDRKIWLVEKFGWTKTACCHMTPEEAKSFADTRQDIYGFTYNINGQKGGSAFFKKKRVRDCKVWSSHKSHPKHPSKYENHFHFEKTS